MMFKYAMSLFGLLLISKAYAFPCFVTVLKDKCWADYSLTVQVKDAVHDQMETTVSVPKGKSWGREKFECDAREELSFVAQFSPAVWKNEEGNRYRAVRDWFLPEKIAPATTAWNVTVCYPKDFSGVPLPPGDLTHCGCETTGVPVIPPQ